MFEEFKALHGRTYHPDSSEHAARLAVFAANTDKVNRLNQLNARSGKVCRRRGGVGGSGFG